MTKSAKAERNKKRRGVEEVEYGGIGERLYVTVERLNSWEYMLLPTLYSFYRGRRYISNSPFYYESSIYPLIDNIYIDVCSNLQRMVILLGN